MIQIVPIRARMHCGNFDPSNAPAINEKRLIELLHGPWVTQGIYIVTRLRIPDLLKNGPKSVKELATTVQAHESSLYRIMRSLAGAGIFTELPNKNFDLMPMGHLLVSPSTTTMTSMRNTALYYGTEWRQKLIQGLDSTVQNGKAGVENSLGMSFQQYMAGHTAEYSTWEEFLRSEEDRTILKVIKVDGIRRIVELGGRSGRLLRGLLDKEGSGETTGILFELSTVPDGIGIHLKGLPLHRWSLVQDDFLKEPVPLDGDLYVMKYVLHIFEDGDVLKILRNVAQAMKGSFGARLIIIEHIVLTNQPSFGNFLDLCMLGIRGKERSEEEFNDLLGASGLSNSRCFPIPGTELVCIEAEAVSVIHESS